MSAAKGIICFHKGGRQERRGLIEQRDAPRDFFYGFLVAEADGIPVAWASTAEQYPGAAGRAARRLELAHALLTGTAWRPYYFRTVRALIDDAALAISFTDHFSLSLGRWGFKQRNRPFLAGLFHGLSDIELRAPAAARPYVRWYIRRAAAGLDRIGFLSDADRYHAVRRYGIDGGRSFTFAFGIDDSFWRPSSREHDGTVLAVGSDRNRDFGTLLQALPGRPLRLITDLPVRPVPGQDVEVLRGSFNRPAISDIALRDRYRSALCVAVILHDCYQPSGQTVTLQAMACGAPVVLTSNRGLWAPDLLRHGENCMMVPPYDAAAIAAAVESLAADAALRRRIGAAARETVERHFPLAVSEASARGIIAAVPGLAAKPGPAAFAGTSAA